MDYTRNIEYGLYVRKVDEFIEGLDKSATYKHALRHILLDSSYGMSAQASVKPISMDLIKELMPINHYKSDDKTDDELTTMQCSLIKLNSTNRNRRSIFGSFRDRCGNSVLSIDTENRSCLHVAKPLTKFPESWVFTTYENSDSDLFYSMSMNLRSMIDTKVSIDNVVHWNCVMTFNTVSLYWWATHSSSCPPITVYTPPRNADFLKDIKLYKPKMDPIYGYFDITKMDSLGNKPLPSDDDIVRYKRDKTNLTRVMKRRKNNG